MPDQLESFPGELKMLDTMPEDICWPRTVPALFKLIIKYMGVALKSKLGYRFVIESSQTPGPDDIGNTWFKTDTSGNYVGHYEYIQGDWRPVYDLPPFHVVWVIGNPDEPPTGFRTLNGTVSGYPNLTTQFRDVGGGKTLFAVAFVGYTSSS